VATLRPVDLDFVRTAPKRYVFEAMVPADRSRVFAAVSGDPSGWKDWFPGISSGAYEGPPGVGAMRFVKVRGTSYFETILAWDDPSRWTFRVDRATLPIAKALVEDWTFEEHANGTLARWTFTLEPSVLFRVVRPVMIPAMARLFRRAMRNLGDELARSAA
jgi:polyketide cyclase/dehydrase/lipid transport protein